MSDAIEIPELVRASAADRGQSAWLAALPALAGELARDWELTLRRTLDGGTEGLVLEVDTAEGSAAVLKLMAPDVDPTGREVRTLLAGRGRGYAEVLRHDPSRHALLMEKLGPKLHDLELPLDAQLEAICATLETAWRAPPPGETFLDGPGKAASLAACIEAEWPRWGRPCARATVDRALAYAEARARAHDPERAVLAHGDAHAWNTLLVPGGGPRRYKFVDPDGVVAEPAYDLAIPMREWSQPLLEDPVALGVQRCLKLATLTGLDPAAIWQWGLVERLCNGLLTFGIGLDEEAHRILRVADAWASAEPW